MRRNTCARPQTTPDIGDIEGQVMFRRAWIRQSPSIKGVSNHMIHQYLVRVWVTGKCMFRINKENCCKHKLYPPQWRNFGGTL